MIDILNKSLFPSSLLTVLLFDVSDIKQIYCLCGLAVKAPGYRYRGPGSIPGATRFFLRSSGSGTGSNQPRDDN
jgi:hypothetical protein